MSSAITRKRSSRTTLSRSATRPSRRSTRSACCRPHSSSTERVASDRRSSARRRAPNSRRWSRRSSTSRRRAGSEMTRPSATKKKDTPTKPDGITKISVAGFKSIVEEQSIEVRPLTILAGANSSGKSSIMQPLLLLKQTLEASYDPGALRLDGPNVRFTSAEQFLSYTGRNKHTDTFFIGIGLEDASGLTIFFQKRPSKPIEVQKIIAEGNENGRVELKANMSSDELEAEHSDLKSIVHLLYPYAEDELFVIRDRFSLVIAVMEGEDKESRQPLVVDSYGGGVQRHIREAIHLPGLRGNPERTYVVAAVGKTFPGTFENYAASIIAKWEAENDFDSLEAVSQDLKELGLTWKVSATPLNDTQVELQVARLPQVTKGRASDMVSIADVGFGVSQTLPVVVALRE